MDNRASQPIGAQPNLRQAAIAYFSMEIAFAESVPTYAGGLGVLAGDTIRAAADLSVPLVAVSLIHRRGYFCQHLDRSGSQHETPVDWDVSGVLEEMPDRCTVTIEGRGVQVRAWKYEVAGIGGWIIPVYLLDTDLPDNSEYDRSLTSFLYGGDKRYRLCQEVVLGIGGVRMLRALGYHAINTFHMNEGHSSLLTLELLDEVAAAAGRQNIIHADVDRVRARCVFTTHTPVPAGHDQFSMALTTQVLGRREVYEMQDVFCCDGVLNMTYLALNLSHYVNGVAKRHGMVTRNMYSGYAIDSITNGVHAATWVSPAMAQLYDRYIPGWRRDNFSLRSALSIPGDELAAAHATQKRTLLDHVAAHSSIHLDPEFLTIGFARRMTAYKRPTLLFDNPERLRHIARHVGPVQVIFAGKAHPRDEEGKALIRQIYQAAHQFEDDIRIAYLVDYDMPMARLLTAGVDVWLNTPEPPQEASGTSGMKAAMNGVPSLSVLDGWWIEGCLDGLTGWSIGRDVPDARTPIERERHSSSLYERLEADVVPTYYKNRDRYVDMMRHAIALNGSFFNTQRMVEQYVLNAYFARQPDMFPHLPPQRVDDDRSTPPLEEASNATR